MSSELPREIVFEILIRLSVKPLLRFRCVSKSWCAMIDSPLFINGHVKRSIETNANHHLILEEWDFGTRGCPSNLYSASIDEGLDISLKGMSKSLMHQYGGLFSNSCNGLIFMHDVYEAVAMWNPFTRRCRKIPTEPFETPNRDICPDWPSSFGFGYDNIHDDYKAVRIMGFDPKDSLRAHEVKVYSLRTNTWKRVQDFPYLGYIFRQDYGAFANGASHWLLFRIRPTDNFDHIDTDLIAAFDYVKEEFQVLPQPEYTEVYGHNCLVALQGCLCMLSVNQSMDATQVTMYVMKNYGMRGSWNKSHIFTQANIPSGFLCARPLVYSMRGDKLLVEVGCTEGWEECRMGLVWYDLQEKKGSKVEICNKHPRFTALVCVESLVRLGEDDHVDGAHEIFQ
ncbi:F-box protein CPR1-like [Tripterygium wilfordii]|uniref:F-box protein CPR1-like n=1 Tax=Tripterygium wilfordii TaxID=458696 RepID=UPI0018F83AE5|nr:F-box protein CPR1-like [Tripterygium wilfordii]